MLLSRPGGRTDGQISTKPAHGNETEAPPVPLLPSPDAIRLSALAILPRSFTANRALPLNSDDAASPSRRTMPHSAGPWFHAEDLTQSFQRH
ncbi:hypothetical protein BJF93_15870 [Xaviernesmea oryzae]|uniref:Uncharacterized protein n=1 Tax=Xaviernesmea oryzae TaxID=464029 RepID=A0A1Q9AY96_9HYPH|nr:hypothetical protein BJF93_15870 [Xaviernesmea oryzae]